MSFAERLRVSRKECGFSQEKLAEVIGVSRQSVTKWENGDAYPELRTLLILSQALNKSLDWMLFDEKQMGLDGTRNENNVTPGMDIKDLISLRKQMEEDLVFDLLKVLNRYEIEEEINSEEFQGKRTYVIYGQKVYLSADGINPKTNTPVNSFRLMETTEAGNFLNRFTGVYKKSAI